MNDTLQLNVNSNAMDTVFIDKGIIDIKQIFFKDNARYITEKQIAENRLSEQKFFLTKSIHNKNLILKPYQTINKDWITIIFILSLLIFAWINFLYGKRLKQILKAFLTGRYVNQLTRDGNILRERLALPLTLIFFIDISLFTFYIIFFSDFGNIRDAVDTKNFIFIFCAFVIVWFIKVAGIRFIGHLFKVVDFTNDYILVNYIINFITGLLILPFMIAAVYLESQVIIIVVAIILVAIFFFWIFRGLFIGLSNSKISLFYYFLYLCTIEILPFIIVLKSILIVMQITVS